MLTFLLSGASDIQKSHLLKTLNIAQGRMLCEIIVNVMYGVLPISRHYKRRLQAFKSLWLKLASSDDRGRLGLISKNINPLLLILKGVSKNLGKLL
jgi:hypothetical protein